MRCEKSGAGYIPAVPHRYKTEEKAMLLILGVILLIIAIAGGAIIHPILFALAIVALVLFFMNHSGRTAV